MVQNPYYLPVDEASVTSPRPSEPWDLDLGASGDGQSHPVDQ